MLSRHSIAVLLALAGALAAAPPAHAAPGPLSSANALVGGAALGTVSGVAGETDGYSGSGACGYPHVAMYVTEPSGTQAFLELDVADDQPGHPSVCEVAVYRASDAFTDPLDAAQRTAALLARTTACAAAASCALQTWIPAGTRVYVAMWAADPKTGGHGPSSEAEFTYAARLRKPGAASLAVYGHRIRELCSGYHEILGGRAFRLVAGAATGVVRVEWYAFRSPAWSLHRAYDATLADGAVSLGATSSLGGRWKVVVRAPDGNDVLGAVAVAYLHYVTPRWTRYADGGVRLTVPYYRQEMNLSCEAASFRSAHNYFDSPITSDMAVLRLTGIDYRRPAVNGGCNPNTRFCGNPRGVMMRDGYGVHYGPILRVSRVIDRCRPGAGLTRYSNATLAANINNGYPVVVWGVHRGPSGIKRFTWRSWDGAAITAYSVEHSWTVIGFRGPAANPTSFIIADPSRSTGGVRTVSAAAFNDFVKYFRTGVVVRG